MRLCAHSKLAGAEKLRRGRRGCRSTFSARARTRMCTVALLRADNGGGDDDQYKIRLARNTERQPPMRMYILQNMFCVCVSHVFADAPAAAACARGGVFYTILLYCRACVRACVVLLAAASAGNYALCGNRTTSAVHDAVRLPQPRWPRTQTQTNAAKKKYATAVAAVEANRNDRTFTSDLFFVCLQYVCQHHRGRRLPCMRRTNKQTNTPGALHNCWPIGGLFLLTEYAHITVHLVRDH